MIRKQCNAAFRNIMLNQNRMRDDEPSRSHRAFFVPKGFPVIVPDLQQRDIMVSRRAFLGGVSSLAGALALGGCTSIRSSWPFFGAGSHPAATPVVHRQLPPTVGAQSPTKQGRPSERSKSVVRSSTEPIPSAQISATGKPTTVTLVDDDAGEQQARILVGDAETRLTRINQAKLTGEDARAYNQASDLASAARKAMVQRDYLAASGLARKSALLSEQLVTHATSN
jgi:hypothetical protein